MQRDAARLSWTHFEPRGSGVRRDVRLVEKLPRRGVVPEHSEAQKPMDSKKAFSTFKRSLHEYQSSQILAIYMAIYIIIRHFIVSTSAFTPHAGEASVTS